jgi:hypothetical protein
MASRCRRLALLFLLGGVGSCAAPIAKPTLELAGGSPARLERLQAGYDLYVGKCSGCHALYPLEKYSSAEWTHCVDEMTARNKVRFERDQRDVLVDYLSTASGR